MNPERLWAKSWDESSGDVAPRSVYLFEHLRDVHAAAQRILDATGDDQLSALGLPPDRDRERFRRIVLLSAATHDLGKANDHFQGMITRRRDVRTNPQGLRHEWVTLLMLRQMRDRLLTALEASETDLAIVEWTVAGHHPAVDHQSPPSSCPSGAGAEIRLLIEHQDFGEAIRWLFETFGLGPVSVAADSMRGLVGPRNVFEELAAWHRDSLRTWEKIRKLPDRLLVAAAKNCLIAADVAGSALPRAFADDGELWNWISKSFVARPEPGDLQAVVDLRLKRSGNGEAEAADAAAREQFQNAVGSSREPVTYLKAGCGTGKTLAAYIWAARNHPTRRLYFCYPTTGTATEGFKDYLFEPEGELGEIGAKLFHSRREVDFEVILSTGNDTKRPDADGFARLESLEAWSTPVVACTVDTVLGIVQNNKRGLFSWPALAQSAFVFDEIHAYDDRLFGALLRFLRDVPQLPALMMTASLPEAREECLRAVLEKMGRRFDPILGPARLEERPRYHPAGIADNDPLALVEQTVRGGGKVLWVCNTVKRAIAAFDRAKAAGLQPLIYHSRFRYVDRVERHRAVIKAFDPRNLEGALAICTQVAEMSLDLSADLLVTDLAPVPALIQRMGRLNRRAKDGDQTKPFFVVTPDNHLPYSPPELDAARDWVARLPREQISQQHLAHCWEQVGDEAPALVASAWLDGGPTTAVTELREASPGITVLLNDDGRRMLAYQRRVAREVACARDKRRKPEKSLFAVQDGELHARNAVGHAIPMPPPPSGLNWRSWPTVRSIPVAAPGAIHYDDMRGAEW